MNQRPGRPVIPRNRAAQGLCRMQMDDEDADVERRPLFLIGRLSIRNISVGACHPLNCQTDRSPGSLTPLRQLEDRTGAMRIQC